MVAAAGQMIPRASTEELLHVSGKSLGEIHCRFRGFIAQEVSLMWSRYQHASAYSLGTAQICINKAGQIERQAGLKLLLQTILQHLFLMHIASLCQSLF